MRKHGPAPARRWFMSTFLLLLVLVGCRSDSPGDSAVAGTVEIVPARLDPGDQLAGMRIESMEVQPETVDSAGWTGSVDFSGTITLTGRYRPHPENPDVRALCFYPDSASATQLPRFPNDRRISWFCFSNTEEAEFALAGTQEGEATIVINEFDYLYQHTDSYNTARLQQVLQRR
jgi:hypothetical protein